MAEKERGGEIYRVGPELPRNSRQKGGVDGTDFSAQAERVGVTDGIGRIHPADGGSGDQDGRPITWNQIDLDKDPLRLTWGQVPKAHKAVPRLFSGTTIVAVSGAAQKFYWGEEVPEPHFASVAWAAVCNLDYVGVPPI